VPYPSDESIPEVEIVRSPKWCKNPFYLRKKPDYSSNTPARKANRARFTRAAAEARGKTGREDGLPVTAATIKKEMDAAPPLETKEKSRKIVLFGALQMRGAKIKIKEPEEAPAIRALFRR